MALNNNILNNRFAVWDRLKSLVGSPDTASAEHADPDQRLRVAAAVLLLEVERADLELGGTERDAIRDQLRQRFRLSDEELGTVMQAAGERAEQSVSLHAFLDVLNASLMPPQKLEVMEMLWQVAYADNSLHQDEEALLRQMSELLHIPHHDFIRVKLRVLGEI